MADEHSPLLQNGREHHDGEIDYSAVNEPEQADSVAIHGSTDAEQQQQTVPVVAPQSSVVTLVRFGHWTKFHDLCFKKKTFFFF